MMIQGFNFIWSLSLEILLACLAALVGITFSFSLGPSSTGMVTEAKACSKPWEAAPSRGTSEALSKDISLGASDSFACSYWLGGRGSWGCISSIGSATIEAASPWMEEKSEAHMASG